MVNKGRVTVYSIVGCPHCIQAKSTLVNLGIDYVDVSIDEYEDNVRQELKSITKSNTVPQIFFNEILVGGNDDLEKLVKNEDELRKMLDKVRDNPVPDSFMSFPTNKQKKSSAVVTEEFVCEPDEYVKLVEQMKKANLVGSHSRKGIIHKYSFVGKDFVAWVKNYKGLSEQEALEIGDALIQQHFGHQIGSGSGSKNNKNFKNDDSVYRLLEDDGSDALNAGSFSSCKPKKPSELSEELRKMILVIYSQHISADGRKVDYAGIKQDPNFIKYAEKTKELQRLDMEDSTIHERLAFFINVYNALVIHANVVRGVPGNIFQRWRFFNTVRYIIGGYTYNLQEIENGVLRANRKGVGMLWKPFSTKDPRLAIALDQPEPLIHFALVCGAKSCPPIKTYSANNIMQQMQLACESFLESDDALSINIEKNQVSMSQIFSWYQEDFGSNKLEVIKWISERMADGSKKNNLKQLIENEKSIKITYLPYDWSVNS